MDKHDGVKNDHETLNIIRKGMTYRQSLIAIKKIGGIATKKTLMISIFLLPSLPIRKLLGIIVTIVEKLLAAITKPISTSDAFKLLRYNGKRD
jgi:hypothetical protein